MSKDRKGTPRVRLILIWTTAVFLTVLGFCLYWSAEKYKDYFGVPIISLLYTMALQTTGADIGFIKEMVIELIPKILLLVGMIAGILFIVFQSRVEIKLRLGRAGKRRRSFSFRWWGAWGMIAFGLMTIVYGVRYWLNATEYLEYLAIRNEQTTLYEEFYVDPKEAEITVPENKKNLIFICLESMETQYASREAGGSQSVNYIPYLTSLAEENISFSNTDLLGGFVCLPGSTWTMGSLFATHSGLPFAFPIRENASDSLSVFASGVTALGDILQEHGYTQEFLCGSDIRFAGRDAFYEQHGNYEIYDYYTAIENGVIPKDYYVWWGMEDAYLYQAAKQEISRLAQGEQPFNFTMLTVDTHSVGGYICDLCEDTYDNRVANVVSCADRQFQDFMLWLTEQPFYEDCVIVIIGDHPRMDTELIGHLDYYDRPLYNCFINSVPQNVETTTGRQSSAMDIFPTTLEALGFEIEGARLGIGTSLFQNTPTLLEEHSLDFLDMELQKYSQYYVDHFS